MTFLETMFFLSPNRGCVKIKGKRGENPSRKRENMIQLRYKDQKHNLQRIYTGTAADIAAEFRGIDTGRASCTGVK